MAWILLAAGLLHLPAARYYASLDYSPDGSNEELDVIMRGTAVCNSGEWVACRPGTCKESDWSVTEATKDRYGVSEDGDVLVFRNTCDGGNYAHAYVNLVGFFFLCLTMALISAYLSAREVRFDEDK